MQEIFIYLDDSGVLHNHSSERYFIYAGYLFLSKKEKDRALAIYRASVKKVNKSPSKELKACDAQNKTKRFLVSVLKNYESFSCIIDKKKVYSSIMDSKKSIHRYKDYCIKRATKSKLIDLIQRGVINPKLPITLRLFIDNQPTSTDGIYNLKESIREEFSIGIANFDYGAFYEPLFKNKVIVETSFCDSKYNYLIQASDMLANYIFTKYNYKKKNDHGHNRHTEIRLP